MKVVLERVALEASTPEKEDLAVQMAACPATTVVLAVLMVVGVAAHCLRQTDQLLLEPVESAQSA